MKSEKSFYSLLDVKENKCEPKWSPTPVNILEKALCGSLIKDSSKEMKKNICYSLQYLEYITFQLENLKLTAMLTTISYKSYIIFGISVIESIFSYILKSNNLYKTTNLEEIEKFTCNEKSIKGSKTRYKTVTTLYKITDNKYEEMNLDSMIKKIEAHSFFPLPNKMYPYLKQLRRLRNKIHLDSYGDTGNTDWFEFQWTDYLLMKYILRLILISNEISCKDKETFEFLKLNEHERLNLSIKIKK